jgi:intracellular multiplication protein IcmE
LPTLVNKLKDDRTDAEFFKDLVKKQPPVDEKKAREDALKKAQEDADKRLKDQQTRLDRLRKEQDDKRKSVEDARAEQVKNQNYTKDVDALAGVMLTDIGNVTRQYSNTIRQVYVAGNDTSDALIKEKNQLNENMAQKTKNTPLYKMGSIIYAVLQTDYNSDQPGPILAKITSGPLAGSTLMGTASASSSEFTNGLELTFSNIITPFGSASQSISVVGVDPESYRTAIASTSNYHYAQRYGALVLAGAIQQAAQVSQNASTSNAPAAASTGSSTTSTATTTSTSATTNALSILTPVSSDITANLMKISSRPPTFTIYQGTAVGLLFLSDFVLES